MVGSQARNHNWRSCEQVVGLTSRRLLMRLAGEDDAGICYQRVCASDLVVEDGYEFFADRQLVTVFSAPNYCGEFDNAGAMMSVDENLMCSFQVLKPAEKKSNKFMMSTKI
ncbi:hypothetical protein F2Q69_00010852 [Brassica cretica]|uniref:Serine/threonine specific protein phosphatases domain-containing protein n=1 Tax=Brassica cretica TaxID=69181 RepID=A0A8S9QZ99_BRACR|nr:hypothetical protein F2Q69_00010852 [Brassica cretica]